MTENNRIKQRHREPAQLWESQDNFLAKAMTNKLNMQVYCLKAVHAHYNKVIFRIS